MKVTDCPLTVTQLSLTAFALDTKPIESIWEKVGSLFSVPER